MAAPIKNRLFAALAAYAALGTAAVLTLDGKLQAIVLIFLGGLALKTFIAYKSGRAER